MVLSNRSSSAWTLQYSAGSSKVVTLRSASVMIQTVGRSLRLALGVAASFWPSTSRYTLISRNRRVTANSFVAASSTQMSPKSPRTCLPISAAALKPVVCSSDSAPGVATIWPSAKRAVLVMIRTGVGERMLCGVFGSWFMVEAFLGVVVNGRALASAVNDGYGAR